MAKYIFDGTMTGILCCVFRAFNLKSLMSLSQVKTTPKPLYLMKRFLVESNDAQANRVWQGLKLKVSASGLRNFYYTFLSEHEDAFQHLFNFSVYAFFAQKAIDRDFGHPDVLALSKMGQTSGKRKAPYGSFCSL